MADTVRLERLTELVERTGAKLVVIGDGSAAPVDGRQRECLTASQQIAPCAELSAVHRTSDRGEQRAWADLRAGRTDRAMAHYRARGRVHMRIREASRSRAPSQRGRTSPRRCRSARWR